MKLTVEDRILIYGLQPEKGPYELLASFRIVEPEIRFTEKETREYDIKQMEGVNPEGQKQMMVAFNKEVAEGYIKEVKLPARISSFIAETLSKKEEDGELTFQFLSLYERFCLGKKDGNTNPTKQSKGNNK